MKRIDRAKAKFAIAPLFRDDTFDVTSKDAPEQMYRLARLVMTKRDSQLLQQTFASVDDVGERKEMFYGLWSTIADIRGLNATEPGQLIVRRLTGKGDVKFQASRFGDEFKDVGALPSDFNNFVSAPSLVDLDRAAARSTIIQKMQRSQPLSESKRTRSRYHRLNKSRTLCLTISKARGKWMYGITAPGMHSYSMRTSSI